MTKKTINVETLGQARAIVEHLVLINRYWRYWSVLTTAGFLVFFYLWSVAR